MKIITPLCYCLGLAVGNFLAGLLMNQPIAKALEISFLQTIAILWFWYLAVHKPTASNSTTSITNKDNP